MSCALDNWIYKADVLVSRINKMPSASRILLVFSLALVVSPVQVGGTWWSWWDDFDWSTDEPANCPHENTDTHVCSTLQEANGTCITLKCCSDFSDDEDYDVYDQDTMSHSDEKVYELGQFSDLCNMCYTIKPCSVYRCHTRCCDGYERDHYYRCRNKTDHIECQNGGIPYEDPYYPSHYKCSCPDGFTGKSCEVPICEYCANGGECMVRDGKPYCNCTNGYYGNQCTQSRCSLDCLNGGYCIKNGSYEFCRCRYDYVGKQCETYFNQPDKCPAQTSWHSVCKTNCYNNADCVSGQICCKEGCSTICREQRRDYCEHEGKRFKIGESYKPDVCMNCTCTRSGDMMCYSMSCAYEPCPDGRLPVNQPGECCPRCPDESPSHSSIVLECPDEITFLNTSTRWDSAYMSKSQIRISANDINDRTPLKVEFSPRSVRHCYCNDPYDQVTWIEATATGKHGDKESCKFRVAIIDNEPPTFTSCPEDIFVFEDESVRWREPTYHDNVGVAATTCTEKANGKRFPVGRHSVTYQIWDYDRNTAFCRFSVSVSSRDTEFDELPESLRERSSDISKSHRIARIVAPILGGLLLIGLVVLALLCCRRYRGKSAESNTSARATPAYDNNIYATPDDISSKLPPYSKFPLNPPAYSITGSEKDVTYMSLPPPSYTNPGYDTLGVHLKQTESVKSTHPEKDPEA